MQETGHGQSYLPMTTRQIDTIKRDNEFVKSLNNLDYQRLLDGNEKLWMAMMKSSRRDKNLEANRNMCLTKYDLVHLKFIPRHCTYYLIIFRYWLNVWLESGLAESPGPNQQFLTAPSEFDKELSVNSHKSTSRISDATARRCFHKASNTWSSPSGCFETGTGEVKSGGSCSSSWRMEIYSVLILELPLSLDTRLSTQNMDLTERPIVIETKANGFPSYYISNHQHI